MSIDKTAAPAVVGRSPHPYSGQNPDRPELSVVERDLARATKNGDILAALRFADTLIRLEPESETHHYNKALLCQHQSEIELAVYEFMQAIWLEPEGPYSDASRRFLEDLDGIQLNQIATLASDDLVFRTKLSRSCRSAAMERGFALSPIGEELLQEFCDRWLAETPAPERISRYQ